MYLCTFRPGGEPFQKTDLFAPIAQLRRRGEGEPTVLLAGPFAAVAEPGRGLRPLTAEWRSLAAAGDVRLDNRGEIAALCDAPVPPSATDLEVVLRAIDARGEKCVTALLGDFAFVVWDARAGKLLAVRDAFGVKPLYWRAHRGSVSFAATQDLLAAGAEYDLDHIADILSGMRGPTDRTIWRDVRAVPGGGLLVQRGTVQSGRRYWTPEAFEPDESIDERAASEQFLALFRDGVRSRLGSPATTWSQLSGGLDSSSVVCMSHALLGGHSLGGTITVVDSLGNGDERKYSEAVVRRVDYRNEQVRDYWAWQEDGLAPPVTDGPRPLFPFFARDRRMCDVIRKSGGRVLLSGFGADHYLFGNLHYVTDMARAGRIGAALRELATWSVAGRGSFWSMAREHLGPLVPGLGAPRTGSLDDVPAYVDPAFAARYGVRERIDVTPGRGVAQWFSKRTSRDLLTIPSWIDRWPFGEDVEVRYPFLHRPLVEASLRLPVRMRVRPEGRKWVLREAMRGLLPEEVRTRSTKGTIDARILWSLQRERVRIDELLRDPILAQLGAVRPEALRDAVDSARRGLKVNLAFLMSALSLETWLAVRAGRWAPAAHSAQSAA
jgi:asparagine synthase (glutamine-hydrolysing)